MRNITRRAVTMGAASALLPRLAHAGDASPPLAIVMNSGDATLSVIDMTAKRVVRTLPMLREPSHWALAPDRSRLLVTDAGGNALFSVDPRLGTMLGHITMPDPYQIGYSPDRKFLAVNCLRLDLIQVYNAADMTVALRLKAPSMPSHLDFSPDSRWSFHSMQGSDDVVSLDLTSMNVRWRKPVGKTPAGVLWLNGKILVCLMGSDRVSELDPVTGEILRQIHAGVGSHNLFLSPDRKTLYVSNRIGGTLAALDPATLAVTRTYDLHGGGPDDIGIAPDGKIWIALRFHGRVAILDPASGSIETITTGRSPHGIFLNTELGNSASAVTAETL